MHMDKLVHVGGDTHSRHFLHGNTVPPIGSEDTLQSRHTRMVYYRQDSDLSFDISLRHLR
ncbi:unnamed protein product [Haemonchus placei]|uniref:Uncharacterized protein n=1 Tax=Haemonchus placei TaxID=6290 RepID=A0A0N4WAP0_HAEPC|nr:unnamed protein product [Haemonchus placei]